MLRGLVVVVSIVVLLVLVSPVIQACPTALNTIPTADIMDPYTLSIQYENDGYPWNFHGDSDNLYLFQMGISPKLEAGVDFFETDGRVQTLLNAKYQFVGETKTRPAISFGATGIGRDSCPTYYLAAAKDFGPQRLHLGVIGDRHDNGLMLGYERPVGDSLTLMADYVSGDAGFTSIGACITQKRGPAIMVAYGFPHDSGNDNLMLVNLTWELRPGK